MEFSLFTAPISNSFFNLFEKYPFAFDVIKLVFLILLLIFLLNFILRIRGTFSRIKYRCSGNIFSAAELSFFLVLKQSLLNDYEIFAKVRIADILKPDHSLSRKNWNSAFYRITSKHFDYVLCDKHTFTVVAVVELDDKTHSLAKVRMRDIFIQKACDSAGLKLLRFPCKSSYEIDYIRDKVYSSINPLN
ncbi:MAG: DUF2726 domain-containing protein [Nitrosomonas sp.]